MKKNLHFIGMAAIMMMAACSVACKKSEDLVEKDVPTTEQVTPKYTMTVNATKDGGTKALSDNGSAIISTWTADDAVEVWTSDGTTTKYGTLTAQSGGSDKAVFSGVLDSNPTNGETLLLRYLSASYNSQNGTLTGNANSIDKVCDYAEATVIATVVGESVTTSDAEFTSQQALAKFNLKWNNADLNVNSLSFSAASNKLVSYKGNIGKSTYASSNYIYDGGTGSSYGIDSHSSKILDGQIGSTSDWEWTGTKWCTYYTDMYEGKWLCEFHTTSAVRVDGYRFITGNDNTSYTGRNPSSWVLKAKLDSGDDWTTIATVSNDATMEDKNLEPYDFNVDVPGTYQYFRLEISDTHGSPDMQLTEMLLFQFGYGTFYGDVTVSPAPATNELYVALRNENGAADTYTITASDGTYDYYFQRSGIYFEYGHFYPITLNMWRATTVGIGNVLGGKTGYDSGPYNLLLDGDKGSKWCSYQWYAGTYASRVFNQSGKDMVIWKMDSGVVLAGYILTTGDDTETYSVRNWKSWTIYGGNFADDEAALAANDGDWTQIQSIVDDTVLQAKNTTDYLFATGNSTAYKYYKLVIDDIVDINDNIQQMGEFTPLIK